MSSIEGLNWFSEFYLSLIAYFVLHLLIVTSSDFVDAFNIPPLNIGIYVDKLAAIRALLMVIADILEYGVLDQAAEGSKDALMQLPLIKGKDGDWAKVERGARSQWHRRCYAPDNPRRWGSIVSFLAMLVCRCWYMWIVYKSDNKSLSVFIVLCIEGFWFGVFQMSFFAIGPQYNAVTSLGIHTMGNFIFFLQLILNNYDKKYPHINCLYRVRVHAKICFATTALAFFLWLCFCLWVTDKDEDKPSEFPDKSDVWSPLLLFIVGAFAEDFSVPGILPFALLDTDKAALVNYCTPVFFMSGALMTVTVNDFLVGDKGLGKELGIGNIIEDLGFKDWSAGSHADKGQGWHSLWLLNVPKYIAFLLAMFGIHGTFGRLRCIVQSRWRVMLLTMFVVIPRAWLETAGYVGVANYALARAAISSHYKNSNDVHQRSWDNDSTTKPEKNDYGGFAYIAYHDMLAMFCRFVYGKFSVGYNYRQV